MSVCLCVHVQTLVLLADTPMYSVVMGMEGEGEREREKRREEITMLCGVKPLSLKNARLLQYSSTLGLLQ